MLVLAWPRGVLFFRCLGNQVKEHWEEVSQLCAIGEDGWEENGVFRETFQNKDPESHVTRKEEWLLETPSKEWWMKTPKKGEAGNLALWQHYKGSFSVVLQLQNGYRTWRTGEEENVPSETAEAQSSVCMKEKEGDS